MWLKLLFSRYVLSGAPSAFLWVAPPVKRLSFISIYNIFDHTILCMKNLSPYLPPCTKPHIRPLHKSAYPPPLGGGYEDLCRGGVRGIGGDKRYVPITYFAMYRDNSDERLIQKYHFEGTYVLCALLQKICALSN